MKIKCKCGNTSSLLFNGYDFGDRVLEGVMFKVSINNNQIQVSSVDEWETDPYLSGLDKQLWLERAREYCEDIDYGICPVCGEEIYIEE